MSNLFLTIPVPTANGVGASVDVSAMSAEKTITVNGSFDGDLFLDASEDGVNFAPLAYFQGPSDLPILRIVSATAQFVRCRREKTLGGGGVVIGVGAAEPAGAAVEEAGNVGLYGLSTLTSVLVAGAPVPLSERIACLGVRVGFGGSLLFDPGRYLILGSGSADVNANTSILIALSRNGFLTDDALGHETPLPNAIGIGVPFSLSNVASTARRQSSPLLGYVDVSEPAAIYTYVSSVGASTLTRISTQMFSVSVLRLES